MSKTKPTVRTAAGTVQCNMVSIEQWKSAGRSEKASLMIYHFSPDVNYRKEGATGKPRRKGHSCMS